MELMEFGVLPRMVGETEARSEPVTSPKPKTQNQTGPSPAGDTQRRGLDASEHPKTIPKLGSVLTGPPPSPAQPQRLRPHGGASPAQRPGGAEGSPPTAAACELTNFVFHQAFPLIAVPLPLAFAGV